MLRGEFIRGDGLVIPNNITSYGIKSILQWALRDENYSLHIGLANCNPDPDLEIGDLNEPTIGVNGYARQEVTRATDWPVYGDLNGETYYETSVFIFEATGGDFDQAATRLALINSLDATTGALVVALSAPFEEIVIDPTLDEEFRSFKYRIYGR